MNRNKIIGTVASLVIVMLVSGCGGTPTYTFEGTPDSSMNGDDDGYSGEPRDVNCFQIEADASTFGEEDDDGDMQLGTFCKQDDQPSSTQDSDDED